MAIEAVDRAMRGETRRRPIYEGEDGVIAWLLGRPGARVRGAAAGARRGQARHSRHLHQGALGRIPGAGLIDLARRLRDRRSAISTKIEKHRDPHQPPHPLRDRLRRQRPAEERPDGQPRDARPLDPVHLRRRAAGRRLAPRRRSYAPERAGRADTVALWHKISTDEDPEWTRRYHSHDPNEKAFGGRVVVTLKGGSVISDEIAVADAHPLGARPFGATDYIRKFRTLADGVISRGEQDRFIATVERLPSLKAGELTDLTFTVDPKFLGSDIDARHLRLARHAPVAIQRAAGNR